jgi:hypothetical protein
MCARAQIGVLRNDSVVTECNFVDVVKPHAVTDPTIVTNDEFPGIRHPDAGPDKDIFSDPRAEEPQSEPPPCVKHLRRWTYE